jgi:hypothetical protein
VPVAVTVRGESFNVEDGAILVVRERIENAAVLAVPVVPLKWGAELVNCVALSAGPQGTQCVLAVWQVRRINE